MMSILIFSFIILCLDDYVIKANNNWSSSSSSILDDYNPTTCVDHDDEVKKRMLLPTINYFKIACIKYAEEECQKYTKYLEIFILCFNNKFLECYKGLS